MPKINIKEVDKTTVEYEVLELTDIAYVPGTSLHASSDTSWTVTDTASPWYKEEVSGPMLCTSVSQFEAYFGSTPAYIHNATSGNWYYDKNYIYAKELINAGLPVLYEVVCTSDYISTGPDYSSEITSGINRLSDSGDYNFKYLTAGALDIVYSYAWSEELDSCDTYFYPSLVHVACTRGDCIALIDAPNNIPVGTPTDASRTSVYGGMVELSEYCGTREDLDIKYSANISPWAKYRLMAGSYTLKDGTNTYTISEDYLPGSFAYLMSLAKSIRTNPNYLAIAGVTRGLVPNIIELSPDAVSDGKLTNKIADDLQPRDKMAINCITNIRPYGLTIWGNRTLLDNSIQGDLIASSFLNLRNLMCDVKKNLYNAAKSLMFEQNSDILWVRFKSKVTPMLDSMKYDQGIKDYKLTKIETKARGKLQAEVTLYPIYAVEAFDITVILTDDDVTVE